jgi:hypothetical protein
MIARSWGVPPVVVEEIAETYPGEVEQELRILELEARCQKSPGQGQL